MALTTTLPSSETSYELNVRPPIQAEAMSAIELAELLSSPTYFGVGVPRGQGRPVLVLPGFMGGDDYLLLLRGWLRRVGYQAFASGIAINSGTPMGLIGRLLQRVDHLSKQHPGRMLVVGHSLGGIFARMLAALRPDAIAQVVSLGSPLKGEPRRASHPMVASLTEMLLRGPDPIEVERELESVLFSLPLPDEVELACVYSRRDAVVDWRACVDPHPRTKAVEVQGSHCGLVWNEAVYRALGRLLAAAPR